MKLLRAVAVLMFVIAAAALPLAAQCAMCARNAAGQSPEAMRALNSGILMLLVPPVAILSAILVVAFRYRN